MGQDSDKGLDDDEGKGEEGEHKGYERNDIQVENEPTLQPQFHQPPSLEIGGSSLVCTYFDNAFLYSFSNLQVEVFSL